MGLFRGSNCNTAGPLTLGPGTSTGTFSIFGGDAGTVVLGLNAPNFTGTTQSASAVYATASSIAFVTTVQTVRAGDCSSGITIELRDGANNPLKTIPAVTVALTSYPAPGLSYFNDSMCSQPITQTTIPAGASRATFYASRDTGQQYTMSATSSTANGSRTHIILPVVRTGSCALADTVLTTTCAVSPPQALLSDSFLVYQVLAGTSVSGGVSIRCDLDSPTNITCTRTNADGLATINWQTAEVRGASVRKAFAICNGTAISVPLSSAAPVATSFILTAQDNSTDSVNNNDFNIAQLSSTGTAVDYNFSPACADQQSGLSAQVVTLPNIAVDRGTTSIAAGANLTTIGAGPTPQSGVVFAQWHIDTEEEGICDRSVRPYLTGSNINLSRGNGAGAFCTTLDLPVVAYERVDFKNTAAVQQVGVTMATGVANTNTSITSVDRTRTLVFAGGQSSMGQGYGEGSYEGNGGNVDYLGDVAGSFALGGSAVQSTQLTSKRSSQLGSAQWSVFVVELKP
jgi:hypothetical protein